MLKYKKHRFAHKNSIICTKTTLEKIEEEKLEKEKEEKEQKLKELQEEFYSDSDNEDENDYDLLVEELNMIKNKRQLIIFVKEKKNIINNLDNKHEFLQLIQNKYF